MPKRRVIVYVDGYNLYHAVKDLQPNKINLWSFFFSFIKEEEELVGVKYFTAYAEWMPSKHTSHIDYINALNNVGVETIFGHFKKKRAHCKKCLHTWTSHEEKETDTNIALHLTVDALDNEYDRAYLVSGDSDLSPAVYMVKERLPDKGIFIVTPPGSYAKSRDLRNSGHASTGMTEHNIKQHMFNYETCDALRLSSPASPVDHG